MKLNLFFADHSSIPGIIKNHAQLSNEIIKLKFKALQKPHTEVFNCDDIDAGALLLKEQKDYNDALIIDVSECNISQLTQRIDSNFNKQTLKLSFKSKKVLLTTALDNGRSVILTGVINSYLSKNLEPYLQRRLLFKDATGQLAILTTDKILNNFHKTQLNTLDFKTKLYPKENPKQSLVRINALQKSLQPWQGLRAINSICNNSFRQPLDYANAGNLAQSQLKNRADVINNLLFKKDCPFVFLAGITGVGKSTFVERNYNNNNYAYYKGEDSLIEWANDKSNKIKILFIDEANIGDRNWTEFESLFNTPAGVRINDKYIEITNNHKVIFAGNPLSYGGGRKMATLFSRHGNSVLFEPLAPAFIYDKIMKKVFHNCALEKFQQDIAEPYKFCSLNSQARTLISPREIELIANLVKNHIGVINSKESAKNISQKFVYLIGKTLIPEELYREFDNKFKSQIEYKNLQLPEFNVTKSRLPALTLLQEFLDCHNQGINPGLGGIILEGQPGIGKTQMLMAQLKSLGYKVATLKSTAINKSYYYMPVSMQTKDKQKLLLKAFDEGAIVIVDEINSAPMMERLLNDLLMGVHPDGKKPQRCGFMLLCTQNPISMAGRRSMSQALSRRLLKINLPEYTANEMIQIITNAPYNMTQNNAQVLVNAYNRAKHHQPKLTFRALLNIAKNPIDQRANIQMQPILTTSQDSLVFNNKISGQPAPLNQLGINEAKTLTNFKVRYQNQIGGFFKFFKRPGLDFENNNLSLSQIIEHAQGKNTNDGYTGYRSLQILKDMNILDDDKELVNQNDINQPVMLCFIRFIYPKSL